MTTPPTTPSTSSSKSQPEPMGPGPMGRGGPMGHGPMGMMKGEKPRDTKGTLRKLLAYLGSYKLLDPDRLALRRRFDNRHDRRTENPGRGHHRSI